MAKGDSPESSRRAERGADRALPGEDGIAVESALAAAEAVHGSGFLAAFAAGMTISVFDVELCDCFREYGETTAPSASPSSSSAAH